MLQIVSNNAGHLNSNTVESCVAATPAPESGDATIVCCQETRLPENPRADGYEVTAQPRYSKNGGGIATLVPTELTVTSQAGASHVQHTTVKVTHHTSLHILNVYIPP